MKQQTLGKHIYDKNMAFDCEWESVNKRYILIVVLLYAGIFYMLSVIGPVIAFIGGGTLLDTYVDFNKVNTNMLALRECNKQFCFNISELT